MQTHSPPPTGRPRRPIGPWLLGGLGLVAGVALFVVMAQVPAEPVLTIINQSTQPMAVSVDGERVRVLRGGTEESLELPVAIWAQPRTIEVHPYPDGPRLVTWRADLTDLADQRWRLIIP